MIGSFEPAASPISTTPSAGRRRRSRCPRSDRSCTGRRAGRCEVLAAGQRAEAEGVEKRARRLGAGQPARLVAGVAEVESHAAAALREDEEVHVALGADDLQSVGPAVRALDQHAGEEVMRRIAMQRDAGRFAHLRAAAVGADDQAAARAPALAPSSVYVHRRRGIGVDAYVGDTAQDRRSRLRRLDPPAPGRARDGRCRAGRGCRARSAVRSSVMAAAISGDRSVSEGPVARRDDGRRRRGRRRRARASSARRRPTARSIRRARGRGRRSLFSSTSTGLPGARQDGRERAAADPAADDHDIEAFVHGAPIRRAPA